MAPSAPQSIPPVVRWLLIVLLPALGFLVGAVVTFSALPLSGAFLLVTLLAGVTGAFGALAAGLLLAPWLPAKEVGGGTAIDDGVPPAPHPEGLSWIGPAAAVLVGLGAGVAIGAALLGRAGGYSYYDSRSDYSLEPFTPPALAIVLVTALAIALLVGHHRHGDAAAPAAHAPFHRVVLRCLLRGGLTAVPVALMGLLALWLHDEARRPGELLLASALGGAGLAALLTLAETVAWRVPWAWRLPVVVAGGALAPPVIALVVLFFATLLKSGSAMDAGADALDALAREALRSPDKALGLVAAVALPFALLVGARVGFVPYFGRRAPWPLVAQAPLCWLAAALLLALLQLFVGRLQGRELGLFATYLGLTLPTLLVMLRLAEPVEQRLATRWVLLTGGTE